MYNKGVGARQAGRSWWGHMPTYGRGGKLGSLGGAAHCTHTQAQVKGWGREGGRRKGHGNGKMAWGTG